jgi:hypothetical protein
VVVVEEEVEEVVVVEVVVEEVVVEEVVAVADIDSNYMFV